MTERRSEIRWKEFTVLVRARDYCTAEVVLTDLRESLEENWVNWIKIVEVKEVND